MKTIDLTNLDTSKVTNMLNMFLESSVRKFIGLNDLDVSNVTNMDSMFSYVSNIPDISGWDTSNVTDMSYMFSDASTGFSAATPLDLSGWDVTKVTEKSYFIGYINPLGSIIPPNFN